MTEPLRAVAPPRPTPDDTEQRLRELVCLVGRNLWSRGMVAANDGNVSARLPDGRFLCTPTGVSKGFMTEQMLPILTLDGEVDQLGAGGERPSSEFRMHLRAYQVSPDVQAVVHAHPLYATAFAIKGEALVGKMMPETIVAMPEVPLATYATPSTEAVADSIEPFITDHTACLLEHHGALTWAGDLMSAYLAMERLEYSAQMTYVTRQLGGERDLSEQRIAELRSLSSAYPPG